MLRTTLQNDKEGQPYSRQKFLRAKTFASKGLPLHLIIYCRGNPFAVALCGCPRFAAPFHQTSSWYGTFRFIAQTVISRSNVRNIS